MTAGTTVPPWEARAAAGERNQKERLGFSATPLLTGSLGGGKLVAFMLLYNKINYSKPRGSSLGGGKDQEAATVVHPRILVSAF